MAEWYASRNGPRVAPAVVWVREKRRDCVGLLVILDNGDDGSWSASLLNLLRCNCVEVIVFGAFDGMFVLVGLNVNVDICVCVCCVSPR